MTPRVLAMPRHETLDSARSSLQKSNRRLLSAVVGVEERRDHRTSGFESVLQTQHFVERRADGDGGTSAAGRSEMHEER